jgi:C4-dicarboxylate transporter
MDAVNVIFIIAGLFSVICALMDFEWFMNHRRARLLVKLLSRNGARAFYVILGLILAVAGFMVKFPAPR